MNLAILSGNVVKDAKLFSSGDGRICCVSRLAVREDRKPKEKLPTFVDFVIWGTRAEKISAFITQGKTISVTGRLEINKVKKEEKTYVNTRIVVDTVEFIGKRNTAEADGNHVCPEQQKILDTQGEKS